MMRTTRRFGKRGPTRRPFSLESLEDRVLLSTVTFDRVDISVQGAPTELVIGDINADDHPDMIVPTTLGPGTNSISVLTGNGDGSFSPAGSLPAPLESGYGFVLSDLDGDGNPDLVARNFDGFVAVYLGNGDATFDTPVDYPTGVGSTGVVVGDMNGDAIPDVITSNRRVSSVSVLLGNGDGTFAPVTNYAVARGPEDVAIGDLDGDGNLDIVTANFIERSDTPFPPSNNLSILLSNGDGTFGTRTDVPVGQAPRAVALADLDGDGDLDAVATNSLDDDVSVLEGNGDGTFGIRTDYAVGDGPYDLIIEDADGDGHLDLLATNAEFGNTVSVLAGLGDRTFDPRVDFAVGSQPRYIATGDIDGDNDPDFVVSNLGGESLSVLLNTTVANVAPTVTLSGMSSANEGGTNSYSFTVSDPDDDTFTLLSQSCGANGTLSNDSFDTVTGTGSFDCTFPDGPSSSDVSVQVADSDGANSNLDAIAVAIANVAPTVTLSGLSSANEGDTNSYSFTVSDPGDDTFILVSQSCGVNGTLSNDSFDTVTGTGSFDCTFPDGPSSSDVSVQVADSDHQLLTIAQHTGSNDPTTEGWTLVGPGPDTSVGPVTDDLGLGVDSWFTDDNSTALGGSAFYSRGLTPTQQADASNLGWSLRARLRVVDIPDNSRSNTVQYLDGTRGYIMRFGSAADGDPDVWLPDGLGGPIIPLDGLGSGYHLFELRFDPLANSADLFVDGVERVSNYTGSPQPGPVLEWGAGSSIHTGQVNFNSVEFEIGLHQSDIETLAVTIANVAPTITSITVPLAPVNINDQSSFSVDISFTDPAGFSDEPSTCDFDMDSDLTNDVSVAGVTGTSCSAALNYSEPGVYSVTVTVTDKDGGVSEPVTATDFIVLYDSTDGFVTGGGWINSPADACIQFCGGATGKANFGFVSKYHNGATVPTGKTEFNLKAGGLNFHSESYAWLVINQNDTNAQYKGSGTINGELAPTGDPFKFMIWATDLDPSAHDTFRIRIWYEDTFGNEIDVYDNGFDQAIGGGNIQIHNQSNLTAESGGYALSTAGGITQQLLDSAVSLATGYWAAQGVSAARLRALGHMDIGIADLPGPLLGTASSTTNRVRIDANAAGYGWFTDLSTAPPPGRVDLLSVVAHELGHVLGFDHSDEHGVMRPTLTPGLRRIPGPESADPSRQHSLRSTSDFAEDRSDLEQRLHEFDDLLFSEPLASIPDVQDHRRSLDTGKASLGRGDCFTESVDETLRDFDHGRLDDALLEELAAPLD